MSLIEALLVVVVLILVMHSFKHAWPQQQPEAPPVAPADPQKVAVFARRTPENATIRDNAEFFQAGAAIDHHYDDNFSYGGGEFGAPGVTYNDYVMAQNVDPQTIHNHKSFVADRLSDSTKNITGRTWAVSDFEGVSPTPWMGIRGRPVAIGESAKLGSNQVVDDNPSVYASKSRFTW